MQLVVALRRSCEDFILLRRVELSKLLPLMKLHGLVVKRRKRLDKFPLVFLRIDREYRIDQAVALRIFASRYDTLAQGNQRFILFRAEKAGSPRRRGSFTGGRGGMGIMLGSGGRHCDAQNRRRL